MQWGILYISYKTDCIDGKPTTKILNVWQEWVDTCSAAIMWIHCSSLIGMPLPSKKLPVHFMVIIWHQWSLKVCHFPATHSLLNIISLYKKYNSSLSDRCQTIPSIVGVNKAICFTQVFICNLDHNNRCTRGPSSNNSSRSQGTTMGSHLWGMTSWHVGTVPGR